MVEKLSKELKNIRKLRKLSLREVEEKTGISNAYLSQLERGEAENPTPQKLQKLAECYDVSYVDLMKAAGYLKRNTQTNQTPTDFNNFQVALMSANLTKEEEEQVLKYIKFLKSEG